MSYKDYLALIDCLLAEGKTTGAKQSDKMYGYGKLNRQRMSRLEKTVSLSETVRSRISELDVDWVWLILTEGWCGDAAQNIPVIEKVASANAGIETRYLLRDENPGLMDEYLTDGARSIPKLIAIDRRTNKVLGTWGSRPEAGRRYFRALKSQGVVKPELDEYMQRWYNADLGVSLQKELAALALQWADTANDRKSLPVAA